MSNEPTRHAEPPTRTKRCRETITSPTRGDECGWVSDYHSVVVFLAKAIKVFHSPGAGARQS